ncbi:MAG: hypothetical protein ACK44W_00445 [Planctomycetota bacterium]
MEILRVGEVIDRVDDPGGVVRFERLDEACVLVLVMNVILRLLQKARGPEDKEARRSRAGPRRAAGPAALCGALGGQ